MKHWGYRVPAAVSKAAKSSKADRRQAGVLLSLLWEEHTGRYTFDAKFEQHGDPNCRVCPAIHDATKEIES